MKRIVIASLLVLVLFIGLFIFQIIRFSEANLHIVFCDVGQGDGIFIRTPDGNDIVIDGGPNDAMLSCLSRHMPFWDRYIELMMVSHPQVDHFTGLLAILKRYEVKRFVAPGVDGPSEAWNVLKAELAKQKTKRVTAKKGMTIHMGKVRFTVLHPQNGKKDALSDINNASIVGVLSYGSFDTLFTGDILPEGIASFASDIPDIEVLKVPHHGSKNGLTSTMVSFAKPEIAVISVGKKNKFGHPGKEVLRLLSEKHIPTFRTDEKGSIEVVSDGKKFWIKD